MKNSVFVLTTVLLTFASIMWAYPVYDIGMGYFGLNRNTEGTNKIQYQYQGIAGKDLLESPKASYQQDVSSFKKLMLCYDP